MQEIRPPDGAMMSEPTSAASADASLPRITVITPSYQQAAYLERTIHSVLSQNYPDLEYIIIDGGSTDGSVEIIRRYASRLAYWVSEPDSGQTDAINKGLRKATGALLVWINSDDLLLPGALEVAAKYHVRYPDSILLGDVVNFKDGQDWGYRMRQREVTVENLLTFWNPHGFWHQPGTFVPRSRLRIAPQLDAALHYHFDREWLCRLLPGGSQVTYLHEVTAAFRLHPVSKTSSEAPRMVGEIGEICGRYADRLSPAERAFLPAGLELVRANYHLSAEYPNYWSRAKALRHLLRAFRYSWRTVGRGYFLKIAVKLITPRWFTELVSERIMERNTRQPLPPNHS